MKKVLVVGGTGAMGTYLVPKLAERGYDVDVFCYDEILPKDGKNLHYYKGDMSNFSFVREVLKKGYDGVVDFMIYPTSEFARFIPAYLDHTEHYIFLSSYRVFADEESPVTETSPQLVDVSPDEELRRSDDYSIYKAKAERFLRGYNKKNWTIVRPAITYSHKRCQLVTLERPEILSAISENRPVKLCAAAKDVRATMTWGGDVAEMLARLLFNEAAKGEDFNVCTAENRSWGEVAEYYREIIGLRYEYCGEEEYLAAKFGGKYDETRDVWAKWQLRYDRLFDRVMDNSKVLKVTGLKQENLTSLYDGLKRERDFLLNI